MHSPHGVLEHVGRQCRLRFVRALAHPPEKVWRALTEAEHLASWFPDRIAIDGEWRVGARVTFTSAHDAFPPFEGELLVYDPPSVLELSWGDDLLRFELTPTADGCILTFTDTFDEFGKAARDAAGWHECLDRLAHDLAATTPPWAAGERWAQVHPGYVDRLGPEASTVGPPQGSES